MRRKRRLTKKLNLGANALLFPQSLCFTLLLILCVSLLPLRAHAADTQPIDEITDYTITIDVDHFGAVNILYHIDWLVLESNKNGKVSWVEVGIPNKHVLFTDALSDNIKEIKPNISSGSSTLKIYFNKSYAAGETISFDFKILQDNMYKMDRDPNGNSTFYFTPGWFDEIPVDKLVIKWKNNLISGYSPECKIENGYHVWETSLAPGQKFSVNVTYPNSAFQFDPSKKYDNGYYINYWRMFTPIIIAMAATAFVVFKRGLSGKRYDDMAGFGSFGDSLDRVKRMKIVYYAQCPGCGTTRPIGKEKCPICKLDLIRSAEPLDEKTIKEEDPEALKYKNAGIYKYTSEPNTYIRVRVESGAGRSRYHAYAHGFHSSCVHSSCACACACACAGGGRAGCSTKDFYNTNLKLRQLIRLGRLR